MKDLVILLACTFAIGLLAGFLVLSIISSKESTAKCLYSEESFNNGYSNILAIESYQSEK